MHPRLSYRTCIPDSIQKKMDVLSRLHFQQASPVNDLRYGSAVFSKSVLDETFSRTGLSQADIVQFCRDVGLRASIPPGPLSVQERKIRDAFHLALELSLSRPCDTLADVVVGIGEDPGSNETSCKEAPLSKEDQEVCDHVNSLFFWSF